MLSNEELTAIKELDLAPEVEQALISLEEKHRKLLFTKGTKTSERQDEAIGTNIAARREPINEDANTVTESQKTNTDELIPWQVQFG